MSGNVRGRYNMRWKSKANKWHDWFAWHPVLIWGGEWVWLEKVRRMRWGTEWKYLEKKIGVK